MQRFSAKKIALAGIGAAIALGAVIASFYVPNLSLTFNIVAAVGIMLPLTMKYYREAILAYVAVCALGAIFANIHILSFVLIGGAYTIAAIAMHNNKDKLKPVFAYLIKIAYSCFVFLVVYRLTNILFVRHSDSGENNEKYALKLLSFNRYMKKRRFTSAFSLLSGGLFYAGFTPRVFFRAGVFRKGISRPSS